MEEFLEAVKTFQHKRTKLTKAHEVFCVLVLLLISGCAKRNLEESRNMLELNYPSELAVVKRAEWHWEAGERTVPFHTINRITIHHGGEDFAEDKDVITHLRNLQTWSRMEKNWIDIPYHFMVDLKGTIYEARPVNLPGDTNTDYDVRGHALICVLGNYENQIVSEQQINSLVGLAAYLVKQFSVSTDSIKGHKDYAETLCPGTDLYRYLQNGTIVKSVKQTLSNQ